MSRNGSLIVSVKAEFDRAMGRRSMTDLVANGCGMQDNKIAGDWLVALLHRHSRLLRDGVQ